MERIVKRFRVFDIENQRLVGKYPTLIQVYLVGKSLPGNITEYFVDDVNDGDKEVNMEDLMDAFNRGELPEDLDFF